MCLSYKIILFTSHSLWYFEDKVDIWAWRKRMNRLTNLLGHPLPVAQKGNKVLTVAPQQVIRHFLADEDLGSLDDFADGQRCVVVVILVVNAVRVAAHHLLQQLHANHSFPAENGLYAGHSGCRAFIWGKERWTINLKKNISAGVQLCHSNLSSEMLQLASLLALALALSPTGVKLMM